ncbi:MAG: DUF4232 domain-containing protein [Actinomycetota bacterium]|nr:DUF4232 domain-containing protein [Actinomycetota bacterium]
MFAAGGLMVAFLVGCSGSGNPTAARSTVASSSTTTLSTIAVPITNTRNSVSTPTTTPSNSSSTTAPTAIPRCQPENLHATVSGQGGATGHGGEIVTLRLVGDAPCTTGGYPGLGLRDAAGRLVPLTVARQTQAGSLFPYVRPATIVVTAGVPTSFGVEWINQATLPATTLIVTPPDGTSSIVASGGVGGGVPNNSVVTVTALSSAQLPAPCGIGCGG